MQKSRKEKNKLLRVNAFMRGIISIAVLIMTFLPIGCLAEEQTSLDFTWSVSEDNRASVFNPVDGNPGMAKVGSDLYVLYSTAENNRWVLLKGTTMDNLVQQPDPILDSSFNKPHGDEQYWCCDLWVDPETGYWYSTVHVEYNYYQPRPSAGHFRRIGLAVSKDKGVNWHYEGDIITTDNPEKKEEFYGKYYDWGLGDQKFFVDTQGGYFYIYSLHSWRDKASAERFRSVRVARCKISDKMQPGKWQKWYRGAWNEPGLGGHDSDVFPYATAVYVTYNNYINKYMALGLTNNLDPIISTCTDMNAQNWTKPQKFVDKNRVQWYNWSVDSSTFSNMITGQSFRLYSSQGTYDGVESKYMTITLGNGTTTASAYIPSYPEEPVMDYNYEYDGIRQESYRQDFSNGINGWAKAQGNGVWSISNAALNGKNTDNSTTMIIDNNAPSITDGSYLFTVTPKTEKKFGAVFRYTSKDNYALIKCEDGNFFWSNAKGESGKLFTMPEFVDSPSHLIEIGFKDSGIIIKVDNQEKYNAKVTGIPIEEGKEGFVLWGNTECQFDNVVYSDTVYDDVKVRVNNMLVYFDVPPTVINDRTMVPMRRIFELFGAKVNWDDVTATVTAVKDNINISLKIDSDIAMVNGQQMKLDSSAKVIKDRTMVPLRLIGEAFGAKVDWDEKTKTVLINSSKTIQNTDPKPTPQPQATDNPSTAPDKILDTMVDYKTPNQKTYKVVGNWVTKIDNRPEYGVVRRLYRSDNNAAELIYKLSADIKTIKVRTYHQDEKGLDQYNFYVSKDGETWEQIKFKEENSKEDGARAGMYFSDLLPESQVVGGYKFFRVEAKNLPYIWANQICEVAIN